MKKQTTTKVNEKVNSATETIKASEILCKFDRNTTEEEIQARVDSINGVGLIHSVKIQPIDNEKFKYQVVAGRKSFAALTQVIGKTELTSPNEVSLIEGDAGLIAFAENDERTDLSLVEQIDKLDSLSEKFGISELASQLSHSPQWIAARIRLKELTDLWKEAMRDNEFPIFTIGHYEAIAKYPEDIQDEILSYCNGWNFDKNVSIAIFTKHLEECFTFKLSNAPWNTDGSYEGCGECPACLDRLNNGFLFEDMNDNSKAICQNKMFYFSKLNEFVAVKTEETRKTNPEILLVSQDRCFPDEFPLDMEEIYQHYAWKKSTKKAGGQKALIVNGPQTGKTMYVEIFENHKKSNSPDTENTETQEEPAKKVSSLAERKERKHRQRQRHAITALMEHIESMGYETPDRDTIFKLIACLGVDSIFHSNWETDSLPEGIASYPEINLEHLNSDVWQKLSNNIIRNLKFGQSGPVEAHWKEAEIISQIVGFDLDKAFKSAMDALPDPKAWKKLEQQETQANQNDTEETAV
jgi:hypothetical protein